MKQYPSISPVIDGSVPIIAFDKLDGSNIRAEWSRKRKCFYKFGRRNGLLDGTNPLLLRAEPLIRDSYEDSLRRILTDMKCERAVCFFEFYGPRSFAGNHHEDDEHKVTLFDVSIHKQGMLSPSEFIRLFGDVGIPGVLYKGVVDHEIKTLVHTSLLPGVTFEGVVCKSNVVRKGQPVMFKVKSDAWLERLKGTCMSDEEFLQRA